MYINFLQEIPYIGHSGYRELVLGGNVSWDLKIMTTIERRPL